MRWRWKCGARVLHTPPTVSSSRGEVGLCYTIISQSLDYWRRHSAGHTFFIPCQWSTICVGIKVRLLHNCQSESESTDCDRKVRVIHTRQWFLVAVGNQIMLDNCQPIFLPASSSTNDVQSAGRVSIHVNGICTFSIRLPLFHSPATLRIARLSAISHDSSGGVTPQCGVKHSTFSATRPSACVENAFPCTVTCCQAFVIKVTLSI